MYNSITLKPRMSEKAYQLSLAKNTYVFDVPGDANKHTVARAVAAQFDVVVTKVNISNLDGKAKRTVTKRRQVAGRKNDIKKAYVTLAEGNSLPFFAAEAAEDAKADDKETK
ncbi:MAG: ribosomal protein [Candidatus Saccharibacteria bacterium]|nr:ribosomal protein [Candidatus Saccharibacteria bacterium]